MKGTRHLTSAASISTLSAMRERSAQHADHATVRAYPPERQTAPHSACACSAIEQRNGANGTCRAATDSQRKSDEAEATLAHQPLQVAEAFDVSNAALRTGKMRLEIGLAFGCRTDRLDAEHQDALVRQPVHGIDVQTRKIVQIAACSKQACVDPHMQENRIAGPDLLSRFGKRHLSFRDRDFMPQRHLAQIKTDRLGIEIFERYLIDRCGAGVGIEVAGSIDVRAGVIAER